MRVFVTGGNGFIGSVVVRKLGEQGHQVTCLLRSASNTDRLDGVTYDRHLGDVRDPDSLRAGMERCDAVIHLASLSSWESMDSPDMVDVVVGGTANILEAAAERGIRVVHVSSVTAVAAGHGPHPVDECSEYNLPVGADLAYSNAKHQAEALCFDAAQRDQDVVVVNPAEVYGPNDTAMVTAGNLVDFATSNPVLVCRGGTSIVHVEDVAVGIIRALQSGKSGERYILGGPNLTLAELAKLTLDLAGKKTRVVTLPNGFLRAVTKMAKSLRLPLPYNPKVVPYATRYWFVDNHKATRELGISFRSARDTLAPTVAWLKEAGHIS